MLRVKKVAVLRDPGYPSRGGDGTSGGGPGWIQNVTLPAIPLAAVLLTSPWLVPSLAAVVDRAPRVSRECCLKEKSDDTMPAQVLRLTTPEIEKLIDSLDNAYHLDMGIKGDVAMPMRTLTGAEAGALIKAFCVKNGMGDLVGSVEHGGFQGASGRITIDYYVGRRPDEPSKMRETAIDRIQGNRFRSLTIRNDKEATGEWTKRSEVTSLLLEMERFLEWLRRNDVAAAK